MDTGSLQCDRIWRHLAILANFKRFWQVLSVCLSLGKILSLL